MPEDVSSCGTLPSAPRAVLLLLLAFAVTLLAVRAFRQSAFWRSDEALFSHALAADGDRCATAHAALGMALFDRRGDMPAAARHFARLRELNREMFIELGEVPVDVFCAVGRMDDARAALAGLRAAAGAENASASARVKFRIARQIYFLYEESARRRAADGGRPESAALPSTDTEREVAAALPPTDTEREVDAALADRPHARPLIYLKYLARRLAGDAAGAEAARRALFAPEVHGGTPNVHYRFLHTSSCLPKTLRGDCR